MNILGTFARNKLATLKMSVRHLNDHVNGKYLDKESFIFVCTCACLIVFNTHAPMFYFLLHRSRRVENNFIIPRDFDTSIAGTVNPQKI